jgi:hypothetical protein
MGYLMRGETNENCLSILMVTYDDSANIFSSTPVTGLLSGGTLGANIVLT